MWTLKHFMFVFANVILAQGRWQHQSDITAEFARVNAQQILSSLVLSVASDRAGRLPPTTLLCLLSICPLPLLQSNNNRVNIGMTLTVFFVLTVTAAAVCEMAAASPAATKRASAKGGRDRRGYANGVGKNTSTTTDCPHRLFQGCYLFP